MSCLAGWKASLFLLRPVQLFPSSKPFPPLFPWTLPPLAFLPGLSLFFLNHRHQLPFLCLCPLCATDSALPVSESAWSIFHSCFQLPATGARAGSRTRMSALPDASSSERLFVFFNTHTHKQTLARLFYGDIYLLEC